MNPSSNPCNNASHITRRTMLQTAGLGGLAWLTPVAHWLGRAQEKAPAHAPAKSVIMLWMAGGPSQLETFDPHAGEKIAGDTRDVDTSVKGVKFAHGLPQVAKQMHELTLVRSMVSKEGDHERATYNVKTGYRPDPTLVHPSIGAVVCHELPDAEMDIPRHISILPGQWPARGGYLGAQYDAFKVYNTNGRAGNITARVKPARLDNRLEALEQVEQSFARGRRADLDAKTTLHNATIQKALRMMSSKQLSAFDITQAPTKTRAAFGDTNFGRGCLAAIQLIGAGVRCVEVTLNGWDTTPTTTKPTSRKTPYSIPPSPRSSASCAHANCSTKQSSSAPANLAARQKLMPPTAATTGPPASQSPSPVAASAPATSTAPPTPTA